MPFSIARTRGPKTAVPKPRLKFMRVKSIDFQGFSDVEKNTNRCDHEHGYADLPRD